MKSSKPQAKQIKPLVGMRAIERVLLRHAFAQVPEVKLLVAVLCQGMADAVSSDEYIRRRAYRFLVGGRLDYLSNLVGLEPEFVREVARRSRYFNNELLHKPNKILRKIGAR